MILDLRLPVFVVTGTWNIAIFTPQWIAKHLFDAPKGAEVQFNQVIVAAPTARQILYLKDTGISVSPGRIEIFMNALDRDNEVAAETTAKSSVGAFPLR